MEVEHYEHDITLVWTRLWQCNSGADPPDSGSKGSYHNSYGKDPGEVWEEAEVAELKKAVEDAGLSIMGIESVNVSDDIKIGTEKRDEHIKNYITTLRTWEKRHSHGMLQLYACIWLDPFWSCKKETGWLYSSRI